VKFSEKWLREWVDPALDTGGLAHRLTMVGLEVESVEPQGASKSNPSNRREMT
jgi:phenylalanyl-tRNA synthetase beta chain